MNSVKTELGEEPELFDAGIPAKAAQKQPILVKTEIVEQQTVVSNGAEALVPTSTTSEKSTASPITLETTPINLSKTPTIAHKNPTNPIPTKTAQKQSILVKTEIVEQQTVVSNGAEALLPTSTTNEKSSALSTTLEKNPTTMPTNSSNTLKIGPGNPTNPVQREQQSMPSREEILEDAKRRKITPHVALWAAKRRAAQNLTNIASCSEPSITTNINSVYGPSMLEYKPFPITGYPSELKTTLTEILPGETFRDAHPKMRSFYRSQPSATSKKNKKPKKIQQIPPGMRHCKLCNAIVKEKRFKKHCNRLSHKNRANMEQMNYDLEQRLMFYEQTQMPGPSSMIPAPAAVQVPTPPPAPYPAAPTPYADILSNFPAYFSRVPHEQNERVLHEQKKKKLKKNKQDKKDRYIQQKPIIDFSDVLQWCLKTYEAAPPPLIQHRFKFKVALDEFKAPMPIFERANKTKWALRKLCEEMRKGDGGKCPTILRQLTQKQIDKATKVLLKNEMNPVGSEYMGKPPHMSENIKDHFFRNEFLKQRADVINAWETLQMAKLCEDYAGFVQQHNPGAVAMVHTPSKKLKKKRKTVTPVSGAVEQLATSDVPLNIPKAPQIPRKSIVFKVSPGMTEAQMKQLLGVNESSGYMTRSRAKEQANGDSKLAYVQLEN